MTRILVTDWLWEYAYSEKNLKDTEKYRPNRYIIASGNIFEDVYCI